MSAGIPSIVAAITLPADAADKLLSKTDWTQLPDSGLTDACVALFKT